MAGKYALIFWIFFKIGSLSFGGGLAMIPAIFDEVSKHSLMSGKEFINLVAVSQVTPGPVFLNLGTYIGMSELGVLGAITATLAVSIPSFTFVIAVLKLSDKYKNSKATDGFLYGVRPAAIGLVGATVIMLIRETEMNLLALIIVVATIMLVGRFKVNAIIAILIMAVAGIFFFV